MQVESFADVAAFLAVAEPFLLRQEVVNGLSLAACSALRRGPGRPGRRRGSGAYLAVVRDEAGVVALTAVSLNRRLILATDLMEPQTAVSALIHHMRTEGVAPLNVRGLAAASDAFARSWAAVTGQSLRPGMRQGVYELHRVADGLVAEAQENGRLRLATADDYYLVRDWAQQFQQEAVGDDDREAAHLMVAQFVQNQELYLWEEGDQPVTMTAKLRPTPNGIAVGMVFTPLDKREHGYARRCVATLSQQLLDEGRQFCTLLTDLSNPTSNRLYRRIGYRHVADLHEYLW
ncbi:MAG: hypothetical protein H6668_06150 [Ardenticatenaceae bacterium]|nr:hypothetical protein [Ardenticatenaceae bacterium]